MEMHSRAGCQEQCRWAQLDGGAGRAAGPVCGMAGLAAGRAAGWIGQGRWGWVGWVDRPGRTGTQVVHPQLLAPALLDNSVGDQPGLPTSSLAASQN